MYLQLSRVTQLFTGISWLVSTMCRPLRDGIEPPSAGGKKNCIMRSRTFPRTDKLCLFLSNKMAFGLRTYVTFLRKEIKKKEKRKRCHVMIYPAFARCVVCGTKLAAAAAADPLLLAHGWPRLLRLGQWGPVFWTCRSKTVPKCDLGGSCCGRPCPSS